MNIEEYCDKAYILFQECPDKIGANLLKRKLHIGTITANKILEILEKRNVISSLNNEKKRTLLSNNIQIISVDTAK